MTDNSTIWCKECGYHCPLHGEQGYLDPVRDEIDRLRAELALTLDTLARRSAAHDRLVAARLACPTCRTLPLEETPA